MAIDLAKYKTATEPARQVLYDYFGEDFQQVENLQRFLFEKGWKVVPIEPHGQVDEGL